MKPKVVLTAAALILFGCVPVPSQPTADIGRAPVEGLPLPRANLDGIAWTDPTGELPSMPWPRFQGGLSVRANEAELAIILRGHELRERHPDATARELAQMLVREDVWEQNAKLVPSTRRAIVAREALVLW
jgi:hypothetical protein